MKRILAVIILFASAGAAAQGGINGSVITRLNAVDFEVRTGFAGGVPDCDYEQSRMEFMRNDTLFLVVLFDTRVFANAQGCSRRDTLTRTIADPGIQYIHVVNGAITFDDQDIALPDTVWSIYGETYPEQLNVPEMQPEQALMPHCDGTMLSITCLQPVKTFAVLSEDGRQLFVSNGDPIALTGLPAGVYLLRVVTVSGAGTAMRWFYDRP